MRTRLAALAAVTSLSLLAGCAGDSGVFGRSGGRDGTDLAPLELSGSEVLLDPDASGVDVSRKLFDRSPAAVVSGPSPQDTQRASQLALDAGVPLLTVTGATQAAVSQELARLGASTVFAVDGSGVAQNLRTPDGADKQFTVSDATSPNSTPDIPRRDPNASYPPILVTKETSPAATTTAKAAGAELVELDYPDPRAAQDAKQKFEGKKVLALGAQFRSSDKLNGALEMLDNGELPGGGTLVFPGRRMVALYGHPSGPALGAMGEQGPAESVERIQKIAAQYQPLSDKPVVPAFEVIATVAAAQPGPDGNYTNESDVAELRPYVEAIGAAGGYAVLDLQPGRGSFLEQAKLYEELLRLPYVGLALDAEWKIGPGEQPMQRVGSAEPQEINETAEWLAELVRKDNLPQKAFILHQFQVQMLRDREEIRTDHPELATILHVDGHGTPEQKMDTWNVLLQGLQPGVFMAWKNFYDEDKPMFTPEQTYDVTPQPWFVSYQ